MEYVHLLLFISILNIIGTLTLKTGRCLNYSVDCYYAAKERIKDIIRETNDQEAFILIDVAFALIFLPSFLYFLLTIIVIKKNIILILAIVYLCEKIYFFGSSQVSLSQRRWALYYTLSTLGRTG